MAEASPSTVWRRGLLVYNSSPSTEDESDGVRVWCDMGQDEDEEGATEEGLGGGGWTVILQRRPLPQQINFRRGWEEYKEGFGDPESEYWIGEASILSLLHSSSSSFPL